MIHHIPNGSLDGALNTQVRLKFLENFSGTGGSLHPTQGLPMLRFLVKRLIIAELLNIRVTRFVQ
jgi:hypothetical protein